MVNSQSGFSFSGLPKVIFGAGKSGQLVDIIKGFGSKILLITGRRALQANGDLRSLVDRLEALQADFYKEGIVGEPSPDMVNRIVEKYHGQKISAVVALGGGAVLDGGKAISAMLPSGMEVEPFLEGVGDKKHGGEKIPFIALPTTSGTGSEMTSNAVLSKVGPEGYKKSLRHEKFIPDVAVVDPLLTVSCPSHLSASCGMDSYTQLVESYLSTNSSPITEDLAFGAIKRVMTNLPLVSRDGQNIEARAALSYGSMISGITLMNCGLGAVHGFASTIGGKFSVPHGVVCGALMASANRVTLQKLRKTDNRSISLRKYEKLGELCHDGTGSGKSSIFYQDLFISHLDELTESLKIPRLGAFGLGLKDIDRIVSESSYKNNPVPLDKPEMSEILERAL